MNLGARMVDRLIEAFACATEVRNGSTGGRLNEAPGMVHWNWTTVGPPLLVIRGLLIDGAGCDIVWPVVLSVSISIVTILFVSPNAGRTGSGTHSSSSSVVLSPSVPILLRFFGLMCGGNEGRDEGGVPLGVFASPKRFVWVRWGHWVQSRAITSPPSSSRSSCSSQLSSSSDGDDGESKPGLFGLKQVRRAIPKVHDVCPRLTLPVQFLANFPAAFARAL